MRINKGIGLSMNDFAIPGNVITKEIESDHIFSKKNLLLWRNLIRKEVILERKL